jgi:DNA-binding LacI/PurR family transcriptional regulator
LSSELPAEAPSPTMVDVARLARVSHMTVSRVLNDQSSVRLVTRERVLAAIDQLGYRRNVAARALVTGRSQMLGVVTLDSALYGPVSTLYGVEQAAREAGYFVAIVAIASVDRASVRDAISRLADHGVEGIIVIAPLTSASTALTELSGLTRDLPVVAVEGRPGRDVAVVSVDQIVGARAATAHLLDLGHQTVWHIAGPADWFEATDRVEGWRAGLKAAGADVPPMLRGDWTPKSGYDAGRIIAASPEVSAVFVANDSMALGVLRALSEAGRDVPGDVSVVGFDDVPDAEYYAPALTTVRQDFGEVGRQGLRLLLGQIETGVPELAPIVIPSNLVVRRSTAPPKR